jgi:hypothetical protein
LRAEAPDLVAFTVIVRGARRFAVLVVILVLAFIVVFGISKPRSVRGIFAGCSGTSARASPRCATSRGTGCDTAFSAASHRFTIPTWLEGLPFAPLSPLCFLDGICDGFFQIANAFLQLAFGLLLQPLGLLLLAPHQLPGFFLDLAAEVFQFTFNLILVWGDGHDHFLNGWLKRLLCEPGSVRAFGSYKVPRWRPLFAVGLRHNPAL